jgi:hypothetical protein
MNMPHVSSLLRLPPFSAGRMCLDLLQPLSAALRGSTRRLAGLALGAACLTTSVSAALILGTSSVPGGFEGGAADWDASGPWKPAPADATSATSVTTAREGAKAVRFIRYSTASQPDMTKNERSEFTLLTGGAYNWGTEYWQGFSVRVVKPNGGNSIIVQHHSTPATVGGSVDWSVASGECDFLIRTDFTAPGKFDIYTSTDASKVNGATITEPNGQVRHNAQSGSATWGTKVTSVPYVTNRWYDFVLHFRLAPDSTGIMEVWITDTVTNLTSKPVSVVGGVTVYKYDSGKASGSTPSRDGLPKTPVNTQKIGVYYGNGQTPTDMTRYNLAGEMLYDSFRTWSGSGGSYNAVVPGFLRPTTLNSATPVSGSNSKIRLTWTDVANETRYDIYRATSPNGPWTTSTYSLNATVAPGSWDATGLAANTLYYFRVRAWSSNGASVLSNTLSARTNP